MTHTKEAMITRPIRWQLFRGLAATLLVAGCSSPGSAAEASSSPSSESSTQPGITVYEDPAFTHAVGQISHFAVECADYKDPDKQSLQPEFVNYYKIHEDSGEHTPALVGYVDPTKQRLLVGGIAQQCTD